jgi:hypothetical protein
MHRIDSQFPIEVFVGARVLRVRHLENIVYIDFERPLSSKHPTWPRQFCLGIEGSWRVARSGSQPGLSCASTGNAVVEARGLLNEEVLGATVTSYRAFVLRFRDTEVEIRDDSEQYESFSIPELNIFI